MLHVLNAVGPFTTSYIAESLEEWLPKASAAGITSLFDAGMKFCPRRPGFSIYSGPGAERKTAVPGRRIDLPQQPGDRSLPMIKALRREFNSELVKASVLKLNIDGGEAQRTAALLRPL